MVEWGSEFSYICIIFTMSIRQNTKHKQDSLRGDGSIQRQDYILRE